MADKHKPRSKIRTAISIIVPLLPILVVGYYYIFNYEFREYINETGSGGFYSAKEDFEMLEFIMISLGGVIVIVILYAISVLRVRKITEKHQESILELINDEKGLILTLVIMLFVSILIYAPYQKYKNDQTTIATLNRLLASRRPKAIGPLPTRVIPAAEVHVTPQKTEQPTQAVFEEDFMPTNSGGIGVLAKIKNQEEENVAAEKAAAFKAAYEYWIIAIPYYKQALLLVRDTMQQRGEPYGGMVEISPDFLECLPKSPPETDASFGEIKLSKSTNVDFKISIHAESDQRWLKISCASGFLIVHPFQGQMYWRIQTIGVPEVEFPCSFGEWKQKVADAFNALIDCQTNYVSAKQNL